MSKQTKIFVKIQIEKDQDSGTLVIKTQFDPNAPNFFQDKNEISWIPNPEEIEFINETFGLIPKYKGKDQSFVNKKKKEKTSSSEKSQTKQEDTKDEPEKEDEFKESHEPKQEELVVSADGRTVDDIIKKKQDDAVRQEVFLS